MLDSSESFCTGTIDNVNIDKSEPLENSSKDKENIFDEGAS